MDIWVSGQMQVDSALLSTWYPDSVSL